MHIISLNTLTYKTYTCDSRLHIDPEVIDVRLDLPVCDLSTRPVVRHERKTQLRVVTGHTKYNNCCVLIMIDYLPWRSNIHLYFMLIIITADKPQQSRRFVNRDLGLDLKFREMTRYLT